MSFFDDLQNYIRYTAPRHGVDPNIALRVALSEGLQPGTWQSNVVKNGQRETSYGPFQLLVGGGLGDKFIKEGYGDPRDPSTAFTQIDFALNEAKKHGWGPWYGAAKAGVGNWDGLGAAPQQQQGEVLQMGPQEQAVSGDEITFLSQLLSGGAAGRPDSISGMQEPFQVALSRMMNDLPPGLKASVHSGYRSPELQAVLWEQALIKYGSAAAARKHVAPPGASQHGFGNAADLTYQSDAVRQWFHQNAERYGLVFPLGHEPWHIELAGARGKGGTAHSSHPYTAPESELEAVDSRVLDKPYEPSFLEQVLQTVGSGGVAVPAMMWDQPPDDGLDQEAEIAALQAFLDEQQQPEPMTTLDQIERLARQGGAGVAGAVTSFPWKAGAMLTAFPEMAGRKLGELTNPGVDQSQIFSITDYLWNQGVRGDELAQLMAGTDAPRTRAEVSMRGAPLSLAFGGGKLIATELIHAAAEYGPDLAEWVSEQVFSDVDAAVPIDPATGEPMPPPPGVDKAAWEVLGWMGALSVGAILAPGVIRGAGKLVGYNRPRIRDIPGGPPATTTQPAAVTISRNRDAHQMIWTDAWAPVANALGRMGLTPKLLKDTIRAAGIETRAGAGAIADSAVRNGKAQTIRGFFSVPESISALKARAGPNHKEYIWLKHIESILQKKGGTVQGMTLRDVRTQIRDHKRADPTVDDVLRVYHENRGEYYGFVSRGRYNLMSRKAANDKMTLTPYEIPGQEAGKMTMGQRVPWDDPFDLLIREMKTGMTDEMTNGVKGLTVAASRQAVNQQLAKGVWREVTKKQVDDNPNWTGGTDKTGPNHIVTVGEHGKTKYYFTDPLIADAMKMDPFAIIGGPVAEGLFGLKRMVEMTTTGVLAYNFPFTAFIRNFQIGKLTTPATTSGGTKLKSAGLARSLYAIPQQLFPQMARVLGESFEASLFQHSPLNYVFPQGARRAIATRMAHDWHRSWVYQMEMMGPHAGTYLNQQGHIAASRIAQIANPNVAGAIHRFSNRPPISAMTGTAKAFFTALSQTMYAIHGAPAFAFSAKNLGRVPLAEQPEVLSIGRGLTGDPRVGGQGFVRRAGGKPGVINGPGFGKGPSAYTAEIARTTMPWANNIIQGIRRIGNAYWEDPLKFTLRSWLYVLAPTTAAYLWARAGGLEYVDHWMNWRSEWQTQTGIPIRVPGRPPSEMEEFPLPQEMSALSRLMQIMLHHSFGAENADIGTVFSKAEDIEDMALSWLGVVAQPPIPSGAAMALSMYGMQAPQTMFGEAYGKPEGDAFDSLGPGLEMDVLGQKISLEHIIRSMGGSVGNAFVDGITTFAQSEEGFMTKAGEAVESFGRSIGRRTPVVRTVAGIVSPLTRDTRVRREIAVKQDMITQLGEHYKKYGQYYLDDEYPTIPTEPRSKGGALDLARRGLGQLGVLNQGDTAPFPGMAQPPPVNPLWWDFAQLVHDRLRSDDKAETDWKGFLTLSDRRGDLLAYLDSLRKVDPAHLHQWAADVAADPELQEIIGGLDEADRNSPTRAMNFIINELNMVELEMLTTIREVEEAISEEVGQDIKLEDLDPRVVPEGMTPVEW